MFLKISITVVFIAAVSGFSVDLPTDLEIVNGTDAKLGEFPFIVSVRTADSHSCGGTILDKRHVLTAAHCVYKLNSSYLSIQYGVIKIKTGPEAENVIAVTKAIPHEEYVPGDGYINDVAVLVLEKPLVFGPYVQPVNFPRVFNATPENSTSIVAGWGAKEWQTWAVEDLQKATIMVYSDEECERIYADYRPTNRTYHICAGIPEGGKGQCSGDSGGPLLVDGVQVGIVSWSKKPCALKGYPGVYTKVSTHLPWIYVKTVLNK